MRRRSKYGVAIDAKGKEDRTIDNIVFDSKREAEVYRYLKALERTGTIRALERQVKFPLNALRASSLEQERVCHYIADFVCQDLEGRTCVYDAKGVKTAMYRLKKKWFELQYGLRIIEL